MSNLSHVGLMKSHVNLYTLCPPLVPAVMPTERRPDLAKLA